VIEVLPIRSTVFGVAAVAMTKQFEPRAEADLNEIGRRTAGH